MIVTPQLVKKEIFIQMRHGVYAPALHDVVNETALQKELFTKYDYDLSHEEFATIGDELSDVGDFYWNDNGKLALASRGLRYLQQTGS